MTKDVFAQLSLNSTYYQQARTNMLKQQIRTWDVVDVKILALMYSLPREEFVPTKFKSLAFADMCIPLPNGQTMMTPKEEAKILQELHIKDEDKVLVLGMDSGYMVTALSSLSKQVIYVDNNLDAMEDIKNKLLQYHVSNVNCLIGNLHHGWQDSAPFDVIFLTGSLPSIPDLLKNALSLNGRCFVVVGKSPAMEAIIITRLSEATWAEKTLFETDHPRISDAKEPESFVF